MEVDTDEPFLSNLTGGSVYWDLFLPLLETFLDLVTVDLFCLNSFMSDTLDTFSLSFSEVNLPETFSSTTGLSSEYISSK